VRTVIKREPSDSKFVDLIESVGGNVPTNKNNKVIISKDVSVDDLITRGYTPRRLNR
jgi:hypothetical protein